MWMLLVLLLQQNTHTSSEDIERGGRLYRINCARCHGLAGEGGRGPNLANGDFYHGATDRDLFDNIRNGIDGTEMPGSFLTPASVWQMVAFVRSLNQSADATALQGNPSRGEALFRGKGACLTCHRVGADGGFAGPDLTTVASRRSAGYLRASILSPDDDVSRSYWTATVTEAGDGEKTTGFIRNEDRHHVLLLDLDGKLRSFRKSELAAIDIDRRSTMQTFDGILEPAEVEDVVAYLASLRKERPE